MTITHRSQSRHELPRVRCVDDDPLSPQEPLGQHVRPFPVQCSAHTTIGISQEVRASQAASRGMADPTEWSIRIRSTQGGDSGQSQDVIAQGTTPDDHDGPLLISDPRFHWCFLRHSGLSPNFYRSELDCLRQ